MQGEVVVKCCTQDLPFLWDGGSTVSLHAAPPIDDTPSGIKGKWWHNTMPHTLSPLDVARQAHYCQGAVLMSMLAQLPRLNDVLFATFFALRDSDNFSRHMPEARLILFKNVFSLVIFS